MSLNGQRVLLKTPINPGSGYGRDGIFLAQGLPKLGCDVHLEPKYVGLPVPQDIVHLFCKEREPHFEVALTHEYPGELGFPSGMYNHADITVGWTMYEFTGFGEASDGMAHMLTERLATLDLVLAYDDVSRQALLPYMDGEDSRLQILQGGYDADFWKPSEELRDWDSTFKFCMNGTMNIRKNPWASMFAFKLLKDEYGDAFDAELHMKTTSMALPPALEDWCPGLKIHYDSWTPEQLKIFYGNMHCLLAPSWGEGKNLPALEAQTSGCPVIVSAFGGHMQWADAEWSYLVEGNIEEHEPGMGSIRITPEALAEKMWYVYNNRAEAKLKGELAAKIIPQQCDWSTVLERLELKIADATQRNHA